MWRTTISALFNVHTGASEPRSSDVTFLPARVRRIVSEQDQKSERLLGLVQLSLGLLFALIYTLAPRPLDADDMFAPVPIALAAFISFSIVRLWFITQTAVRGWFVFLSIVVDTSLLLALIWSFHIQYGQPAAFSLKVPTVLYLFVFIALRSLRFDPRYVLAAGGAAAAGWAVIFFLALGTSEPGTVTRNYVDYISSNRILIGAEVDKIFVILLVTGLLAYGGRRAQMTLVKAVKEEAAGKEVKRFLSEGVAEAISQADALVEAGRAAERKAAILVLDIRGFTRFSTNASPQGIVDMLTGFHARIVPVIRCNNGVVDKFLGDGVMATFGAVSPSRCPELDSLRALDAILLEAAQWKRDLATRGIETLDVNGAVTSGMVVFATLGSESRLEYTVIGKAVNLAAKLEKHNKVAGSTALVPAETLARAVSQGYRPPAQLTLRKSDSVGGVSGTIDLYAFT